jgi:endonuclease III
MLEKERALEVQKRLEKAFPDAKPALHFTNTFELLIAVILSAQTTDVQVNKVTPILFSRYATAADLAKADISEVENIIKSLGFYHNKAKAIVSCSRFLVEEFDGRIPQTLAEMIELPGVGRKSANIVLGQGMGIDSGIAVDTHVKRIAARLGLTAHKDPDKIEADLEKLFPEDRWKRINLVWVLHGRSFCTARKPLCLECPLFDICPRINVVSGK